MIVGGDQVRVATKPVSLRLSLLQKIRLVLEILATYARVRRALRREGQLPAVLETLRAVPKRSVSYPADSDARVGLRIGQAVSRTLPLLPTDTRCLMRSLVLTALLARRGIATLLVIGVRSDPRNFGAHAWVEYEGRPLLPPSESDYPRLAEL